MRVHSQGFGLVEVLVSAGMLSLVALGLTSIATMGQKQQKQSNITLQADTTRRLMMSALGSSAGWNATIQNASNVGMDCLKTPISCTPNVATAFSVLHDGNGTVAYDFSTATKGLTPQGTACNTFDAATGNDACPLHYDLTWKAICSASPCTDTNFQYAEITFTPTYNPKEKVAFNPSNYIGRMIKDKSSWSSGCTWSSITNSGGKPALNMTCARYAGVNSPDPWATLHLYDAQNATMILQSAGTGQPASFRIAAVDATNTYHAGFINFTPGLGTNSRIDLGDLTTAMLSVQMDGNIGIGNTTPAYKLDVAGGDVNIAAGNRLLFGGNPICSTAGCVATSDASLKENIQPLNGALDKILKIRGVEYDWKDKKKFGDQHQIGLIAQDLEKIYPEVVVTNPKTGLKAVAYDHLIAPVIEAIKTLANRLTSLEDRVQELNLLKSENAALKARVDQAQQQNTKLIAYLCSKDPQAELCR